MVEWIVNHPWAASAVTFLLMWSDWLFTVLQERERQLHYAEHYESYPVNTIEGSPLFQKIVPARRIVEPRHIIAALIVSPLVGVALVWIPGELRVVFLGYVLGAFMIVDTTHIGNLLGYRAGRRGLHGKLYLHQRTGYLMQMGRYAALSILLILLAVCSASPFLVGVAIAGAASAGRQLIWMRKVPVIAADDRPPSDR